MARARMAREWRCNAPDNASPDGYDWRAFLRLFLRVRPVCA